MDRRFRVGAWQADNVSGELTREGASVRLEARTMRLLTYMASRPGEVISIDDLLEQVWAGVMVTSDSVYQAISDLRRILGDDPRQPSYIATVPRQGYRLVAEVVTEESAAPASEALAEVNLSTPTIPALPALPEPPKRHRFSIPAMAGLALLVLTVTPIIWIHATRSLAQSEAPAQVPAQPAPSVKPRSVAVLPFLDLTDQMTEEPFADGMSEQLIDRLSKLSGVSVSPAAATFHYKDQQPSVAEVANALHVAYVLEGSVRKSGSTLRVATRLSRAADGFVMWSETYERSWSDKLMIQDDIADEVAKAMATSVR